MDTAKLDPNLGRVIEGRYRLDRRLASGGMATVYLATDQRLDRQVAVKVLRADLAEDQRFVDRFTVEAHSHSRLSHPNVVSVFDYGRSDGLVYLVLEYVPGTTLRELMNRVGPLAPPQALAVATNILEALAAAHDAGYAHRDMKPENVLLGPRGSVKVADFGLARALDTRNVDTQLADAMGTAAYVSPEQVSGQPTDERTDVYGVGILLFEMVTGAPPFSGETPLSVAYQHVNDEVPPPSRIRPDVPPDFDAIVARATRRDPAQRYATAEQMLADVRQLGDRLLPPEPLPVLLPTPATAAAAVATAQPAAHKTTQAFATDSAPPTDEQTDGVGSPPGEGPRDRGKQAAKPRPVRRSVLAVVMMTIAVTLAGGLGWAMAAGPLQRYEVPELTGMSETDAQSALAADQVDFAVDAREFSETVPAGDVVSTDPPGGESIFVFSGVSAVISLGPERYKVPKLRGGTPQEAEAALRDLNLDPRATGSSYSEKIDEGLVVRTKPAAGAVVKRDTPVQIVVSKGPAPVPVPNVVGTPRADAEAQLQDTGLRWNVSGEEFSDDIAKGSVLAVTPAPETVVDKGSVVDLVISKGPPPVPVPSVVDLRRNEAISALRNAGFEVVVEEGVVTPLDRVFSQSPGGGDEAPRGSTVTIKVF